DGITWPEGGNINMMHGDSRVMVVVCLETASLPAPCLSTSTSPRSREEPYFFSRIIWLSQYCGAINLKAGWFIVIIVWPY
ncbi:hypothetical protein J9889_02285, partial [Aeromonas sp. PrichA-15]|nr:hypothetical protein [Aeromonas sp. PrichA-15]